MATTSSSASSKRLPSVFDVAIEAQLSNLFDLSSIMDTISLDISGSSSGTDTDIVGLAASENVVEAIARNNLNALRTPKKSDRSSSLDDSPALSLPESFDDEMQVFAGRGILSGLNGPQGLKRTNERNIRSFGSYAPYSSKLNIISEATFNALKQLNRENLSPEELESFRFY
jgi:hypothetical protein